MNLIQSEPIAIQQPRPHHQATQGGLENPRTPRQRHDTITRIKDSFAHCNKNGKFVSPHLSSPTPPTFIPDGSHQVSRISNYLLVEHVEGLNSGNVFRAVDVNTEQEYICKVYDKSKYRKFTEVYSKMDPHPNINHIVDVVVGNESVYVFFQPGIPQETSSGKESTEGFVADNLHNFIRTHEVIPEHIAADYFTQVVEAVQHCHQNNIVLRDLKLRKFIFRDDAKTQIMLESLEDAYILQTEEKNELPIKHGCLAYISPETLACTAAALSSGEKTSNNVNGLHAKASDVWSMGIMLYTMLVGRYPFQESEPSVLFSKIRRGKFNIPDTLSSESRDLIHNLLRREPDLRFQTSDILQHPWIKKKGRCWNHQSFIFPVGSGGDVRKSREYDSTFGFHSLPNHSNNLISFQYQDQVVPEYYVSEEDETMFE